MSAAIRVFISSRMANGELDVDRMEACALINRWGLPFSAFAYEKLPEPPIVFPSDAEGEIGRSQMFVLLMASTLSPRVVDELRFAQRVGLECYVLARNDTRMPVVSDFLSKCRCPVYGYGGNASSLSDVLQAILLHRAGLSEITEAALHFGDDAWGDVVGTLLREPDRVYELSPRRFEELIAELLDSFGYDVELTPATNDRGRDIVARRTDDIVFPSLYYVETKLWTPNLKVGRPIIQKLIGAGHADRVNGVMLVTPSQFSRTVIPYLKECNLQQYVRLVDGQMLPDWYNEYMARSKRG